MDPRSGGFGGWEVRRGGRSKGGGPNAEKVGARRVGGPRFRAFFFFLGSRLKDTPAKHCIAFPCSERSFVISSLSARIAMPNSRRWQQSGARRGLKVHEELQQQAWLRVLQGRRSPSVQWPRAGAQQPERFAGRISKPAHSPSIRVSPTQATSEASSKVARIERCMALLDPDDTTELKSLQAFLDKARAQTVLPHPAKQVEDCQAFCARAARRLEKARATVVAAQETVVRFEAELQEGLQRLEDLKAATVPTNRPPVDPASTISRDQAEEVCLLRAAVMELTRKRDSLRSRVPPTASVDDPSISLAVVPVQPGGSSGVM